jgi:hypothetical protein
MLNGDVGGMLTRVALDEHERRIQRAQLWRLAREGRVQSGSGGGVLSPLRRLLRQTGRPVTGVAPTAVAERP